MKSLLLLFLAAAGLAFVPTANQAGGSKDKALLTDERFVHMVRDEGKYLQEALAKGSLDKKEKRKVLVSAVLLEAYAANTNHPDRLSVATHAAQLHDAVAAGKLDKAKGLAALFFPKIELVKGKAGAEKPHGTYAQLMVFFASDRLGGFNGEKELNDLQELKDKLTDKQFDQLTELAFKSAAIASMAKVLPPENARGKKDWQEFADEFVRATGELVQAGQVKSGAAAHKALAKLEKTCTKCHDVYR